MTVLHLPPDWTIPFAFACFSPPENRSSLSVQQCLFPLVSISSHSHLVSLSLTTTNPLLRRSLQTQHPVKCLNTTLYFPLVDRLHMFYRLRIGLPQSFDPQ